MTHEPYVPYYDGDDLEDPIMQCYQCLVLIHVEEAQVVIHGDRKTVVCQPCANPSLMTKLKKIFS